MLLKQKLLKHYLSAKPYTQLARASVNVVNPKLLT